MQKILYLHAGAEMYGADKVLLALIKGLDKEAFEAHVILPNDGVLVGALEKVGAKVKVIDYPILRRKYFNPKGILEYFGSYNRYSKKIAEYAKENGITLLHNNTTAVLEGIYLKRKLKLPLIWHVHEIIVKPNAISDFISFLMGRYADMIVHRQLLRCIELEKENETPSTIFNETPEGYDLFKVKSEAVSLLEGEAVSVKRR